MTIPILMPALSPTMTEGKLVKWLVKEGDKIVSGAIMAEIETDKATMEIEAVDEGILGRILVPAGTDNVKVNEPIALLLAEGESKSALEQAPKPATKSAAKTPAAEGPIEKAPTAKTPDEKTPAAAKPKAPPVAATERSSPDRVIATPLARRMAAQAGLDLARVSGSGPRGRVVAADVERAGASGGVAQSAAPGTALVPTVPIVQPGGVVEIPLDNMRRIIARRLTESKQTIPHFYLTIECETDTLLELRKKLNSKSDAYKLSVNDFVIRAAALALKKVPEANASWGGDKILQYSLVDIAVAVSIPGGLITPIIRNAANKGLAEISNEMKDLAARAKTNKLKLEEFQGGTFSISNLGMYGIAEFSAVINPPQGAILALGAGLQRPVVKQGALAIATVMSCTLSCDHRVIDGVLGAKLLAAFKGYIEDPTTMLL
jgi:pyruvate dehydrogenase E2 component (dihydrolipoamide acetyltransferase)